MMNETTKHEAALETLAVTAWRDAENIGTSAAWYRAYEHLFAVQSFLTCLRLETLAKMANDLKGIAVLRGEMCSDGANSAGEPPRKARSIPLPQQMRRAV